MNESLNLMTNIVKSLVNQDADNLKLFFISLNNAFSHGLICEHIDSKDLESMFDCFKKLSNIAEKY